MADPPAPAAPTAPALQVVIDAVDPHSLADFWAAALGCVVEDVAAFARQMVDAGHAREEDVTRHRGRPVWRDATAASDPAGIRPRLLVQRVPETKTVKNRVHLDLHVGSERRDAEVERVVGLGARRLHDGRLGPQEWVTLADPEGNELCIS